MNINGTKIITAFQMVSETFCIVIIIILIILIILIIIIIIIIKTLQDFVNWPKYNHSE